MAKMSSGNSSPRPGQQRPAFPPMKGIMTPKPMAPKAPQAPKPAKNAMAPKFSGAGNPGAMGMPKKGSKGF